VFSCDWFFNRCLAHKREKEKIVAPDPDHFGMANIKGPTTIHPQTEGAKRLCL